MGRGFRDSQHPTKVTVPEQVAGKCPALELKK